MTNNIYIIDSSSLIELNRHNAMDVYVSVWENIGKLIATNHMVAPKEVFNEIKDSDDLLANWAKHQKKLFRDPTARQIELVQEILRDYPSLVNVDATHSADAWVIAMAIEMCESKQSTLFEIKRIVVTEEKLRGSKVKIPFVCNQKSVEAIDIITLFRLEAWKF